MKYKFVGFLIAISMTILSVYANPAVGDRVPLKTGDLTTKQKVILVPPSTTMTVLTTYELNSNALLPGQTVTVALPDNFFYNDVLVAPKGSIITGKVIEVEQAKQNGLNGKLYLRFSLITTPYGLQMPIVGVIKTDDLSGVLTAKEDQIKNEKVVKKASTKKTTKTQSTTKYKTILNFGENVVIPINTKFDIVLTQPITISP